MASKEHFAFVLEANITNMTIQENKTCLEKDKKKKEMAAPLQKPPGYKDPNAPINRPLPPKPVTALPPSLRPHEKKSKRACFRTFCCCFIISHVMMVLLFIAVGGLLYVWLQPRYPEINFKSFDITKFNVTSTSAGPALDAETDIRVDIRNPNQNLKLEYDKIEISLSGENVDADLGEETVPGFVQEINNVTTLRLTSKADNEILDRKSAGDLMNGVKNKNLKVHVEVKTGIGFRGSLFGTGKVPVRVICSGLSLDSSRGGGPKCRIQILDWIFIN